MKVSFIVRKPNPGQYSIEKLATRLVQLLSAEKQNIQFNVLPIRSCGLFRRILICLITRYKQESITHIFGDVTYALLFLTKNTTVITIHDCYQLTQFRGIKYLIYKYCWFQYPMKKAARITVISNETKKQLLSQCNIPSHRLIVIPNPISNRFCKSPGQFKENYPNLLQIGTKDNKNLANLIPALRDIKCKITIIGQMTEEQYSLLKINSIDFVNKNKLTDEQLISEYISADIVTFVSTYEGFGMPIIEAQKIGRVVITSNLSSMPEVAGSGACFVNPSQVSSIKNGILRIISDEPYRDNLINQGYINVKRFDEVNIAKQYACIYKQVYEENYN